MAIEYPIRAAVTALKALMRTHYGFGPVKVIGESGGPVQQTTVARLPAGFVEWDGGVTVAQGSGEGFTQTGKVSRFTVYLWLFHRTTSDVNDLKAVWDAVIALAAAVDADPSLDGAASDATVVGFDASGRGRELPPEMPATEGALAAYVGVEVVIEEYG